MLPEPALTLTIPSLYDGTPLDCRVYHPLFLSATPRRDTGADGKAWKKAAAVFAHPYGPLGGSFDDHVVGEVAGVALRRGCVVGMFNFRGSGGSAGRTSWSARPERDDFMSVAGFMTYYMHFLDPFREIQNTLVTSTPRTTTNGNSLTAPAPPLTLILGGYSYGSIVTTTLPPLHDILAYFSTPLVGSPAAQIRVRAEELATQENTILRSAREAMMAEDRSRTLARGRTLRVGDAASSPKGSLERSHRRSHSIEGERIRRSVDKVFGRGKSQDDANVKEVPQPSGASTELAALHDLVTPQQAYILVSPIQGVSLHLAVLGSWLSRASRTQAVESAKAEEKLVRNPTLAVYGDSDGFVAANRLRAWTEKLMRGRGRVMSKFRGKEVKSAGHFWVEEGVLGAMKAEVDGFLGEVLDGADTRMTKDGHG